MLVVLILAFLMVIAMEVPAMRLRRQTGELWAFWVLLAIGFGLSLAAVENWVLPSPVSWLQAVLPS